MKQRPATVDDYIAGFPKNVQQILKRIRSTIRKAAPRAEESITYRVPTYKLNGARLIYFAGFKSHIGLYPVTPDVRANFNERVGGVQRWQRHREVSPRQTNSLRVDRQDREIQDTKGVLGAGGAAAR